ncbi:MAG: ParA family protein, partial [Gammaproteobacteria bacterium]|nr:ParA family protein [Gammaproteobacteria bacterium]NIV73808.1 AAA family ATPase [Gammaproteobacteria bacterium]
MSGKVVCVANRKGGVGKTTVAVVLAQTVQDQFNQSAAVVDVDPQGSATFALAGPKLSSKLESRMLQNVLRSHDKFSSPMPLSRFAWGQVSALTRQPDIPLALVPCSEELWGLEDEIADSAFGKEAQMRTRFRRLLDRLRREFNVVIVDTPPGRSFFGREAAKAADIILVPCD